EPTTLLGGFEYPDDPKPVTSEGNESNDETKTDDEPTEYVDDPNLSEEENAAKKAEFDKDKEEKEKEAKSEDDNEEAPRPEDYEIIEVPEGFELSEDVEQEFRQLAADNGLSKEAVKGLQQLQVKLINRQSEAHAERVKQWGDSLKTDKEIGGKALAANIGAARAAMKEFFSPAAKSILDTTGLGNHPDIVKGFVRLGKAMGERPTLKGGAIDQKITIADALYPSDNSGDSGERA